MLARLDAFSTVFKIPYSYLHLHVLSSVNQMGVCLERTLAVDLATFSFPFESFSAAPS